MVKVKCATYAPEQSFVDEKKNRRVSVPEMLVSENFIEFIVVIHERWKEFFVLLMTNMNSAVS